MFFIIETTTNEVIEFPIELNQWANLDNYKVVAKLFKWISNDSFIIVCD